MRSSLASRLDLIQRATGWVLVVWQGKVKPIPYRLATVLADAVELDARDGQGPRLHPFSAIHSITATTPPEEATEPPAA